MYMYVYIYIYIYIYPPPQGEALGPEAHGEQASGESKQLPPPVVI